VKQNGIAIQFINNPTYKVQEVAVKQKILFFRYIKNPDKQVQIHSVFVDSTAIMFINNPAEYLQFYYIFRKINNSQKFLNIEEIHTNINNLSYNMKLLLILFDINNIKYYNNPPLVSNEIIQLMLDDIIQNKDIKIIQANLIEKIINNKKLCKLFSQLEKPLYNCKLTIVNYLDLYIKHYLLKYKKNSHIEKVVSYFNNLNNLHFI
jgi:hypothetical protein